MFESMEPCRTNAASPLTFPYKSARELRDCMRKFMAKNIAAHGEKAVEQSCGTRGQVTIVRKRADNPSSVTTSETVAHGFQASF